MGDFRPEVKRILGADLPVQSCAELRALCGGDVMRG